MIKKRTLVFVSVFGALILLIWDYIGNVTLCSLSGVTNYDCLGYLANVEMILLPILPMAILSLFTYKFRKEVFHAWIRFAKWWIPISLILTILTPATTGSSFVPFFGRGHVAIAMSALFLIISLIIIAWKYATTRKG